MSTHDTDTRSITLVDIPLVRRLVEKRTMLDCELTLTREDHASQSALSTFLLPQRGTYTLIARNDKQQVVGQFRLKPEDAHAHIVYLAPGLLHDGDDDTVWLHVLDAMAREAGKNGAQALLAEVDEAAPLFKTLRAAGYAVYARQEIWRYDDAAPSEPTPSLLLSEATDADLVGIFSLFAATVPSMVQPFTLPTAEMQGLVYRVDDTVAAYIAYSEGKNGIYIIPYLHADMLSDAPALIDAVLRQIPRVGKLPVYVCVRRYQDWLSDALDAVGFLPHLRQAVMVKHITAGVRHASFAPLLQTMEQHAIRPAKPPAHRCYHELLPDAATQPIYADATDPETPCCV